MSMATGGLWAHRAAGRPGQVSGVLKHFCPGSPRRSSATRPAAGWCGRARGDGAGQNTLRQPTPEVPNELQFDNKEVEPQALTPPVAAWIDPQHSTRNLVLGGRDDLNRKLVGV